MSSMSSMSFITHLINLTLPYLLTNLTSRQSHPLFVPPICNPLQVTLQTFSTHLTLLTFLSNLAHLTLTHMTNMINLSSHPSERSDLTRQSEGFEQ